MAVRGVDELDWYRVRNAAGMATRNLPHVLWIIAVVLVLLWLVGVLTDAAGGIVHLLLVIALVLVIYRLATGRRVL